MATRKTKTKRTNHNQPYLPTADEIREAAAAIRLEWTEQQRQERLVQSPQRLEALAAKVTHRRGRSGEPMWRVVAR